MRKPDPAIYRHVAGAGRLRPPTRCLFIDDLAANIAAARALGWRTIVL